MPPTEKKEAVRPRAFISYSWSNEEHCERVRSWADRLVNDGVDVVIDVYDLREGDDKHVFMEKSVNDPTVSHVLIVCDKRYVEKANARSAGVGTETQLISKEVYDKVQQSKFISLICERDETGEPYLPAYLSSRIGVDFSSPEKINENWEQLIRVLYGQPRLVKPAIGTAPAYLKEVAVTSTSPVRAKLEDLRQALMSAKPGASIYRKAFLSACFEYVDSLRRRGPAERGNAGARVLEEFRKLVPIRDQLVDWVLLESTVAPGPDFVEALLEMLEQLIEMKSRPRDVNSWDSSYFQAHELFAYETFLYVVAALMKTRAFEALHEVFSSHYLRAESERDNENKFTLFDEFYATADILQSDLAPQGKTLHSPAAELLKRSANRTDIKFNDVIEADMLATFVTWASGATNWFPQLMYYSSHHQQFPLFVRATQHKHFAAIATITGLTDSVALKETVQKNYDAANVRQWPHFWGRNFLHTVNLEKLDTIK